MSTNAPNRRILAALCLSLLISAGCGGGGSSAPAAPDPVEGFRVTELHPFDGEKQVAPDVTLEVKFSDPLIPGTIDEGNFLLYERASGKRITGTVTMGGDRQSATLKPDTRLLQSTGYRIRILPEITSIAGETLPEETRTVFTTGIEQDIPPPDEEDDPTGKISTVGSMKRGRSNHTSTLLDSGKVLVTAGFTTGSSVTATAEVYDPALRNFRFTNGSLSIARGNHTATLMQDGRVLVAGGLVSGSFAETDSIEFYSPSTDSFSASSVVLQYPRAYHTATQLYDGRVLFLGGTVPTSSGSFSSKRAEIYDPNPGGTPASRPVPDMNVYRAGHTATRLENGWVLVVGGNSTDLRAEIYDPSTNDFRFTAGQPHAARRGHTATLLDNGSVLITGGGEAYGEVYVPATDSFSWVGSLGDGRRYHTATKLESGHVLLTGGSVGTIGDPNDPLFFLNSIRLYTPFSGAYLGSTQHLTYLTTRHCATRLGDGLVLITGGSNVDGTQPELDRAQLYTPTN